MLLLVLGLPIVVALAWYHGERVNRRISGPELTIISLLLFGISVLFYVFVRPSQEIEATTPAVKTQIATTNIDRVKLVEELADQGIASDKFELEYGTALVTKPSVHFGEHLQDSRWRHGLWWPSQRVSHYTRL